MNQGFQLCQLFLHYPLSNQPNEITSQKNFILEEKNSRYFLFYFSVFTFQSDSKSGVDEQKNQLTLDLIGQNLALSKAKSSTLPRL